VIGMISGVFYPRICTNAREFLLGIGKVFNVWWGFVFMSWVVGVGCFLVGVFVGFVLRGVRWGKRVLRLDGDEERVYEGLVELDGRCGFWVLRRRLGLSEKVMGNVVGSLKGKGVLRVRCFGNKRILELVGFLRRRDREVLDFVKRGGGRVSVGEVQDGLGVDDNTLLKIGKRLVGLGLVRKESEGYDVFFVLVSGD